MLIRGAALLDGGAVDIRVEDRIAEVADRLAPQRGEQVYDAGGETVIPGLHDHHVHLRSAAAALTSTRVGPAEVHNRAELARALAAADVGVDGWIRAVGYHEAAAGPLDRAALDEVSPPVPVRIQHRSGVLWTLNSAGLARVGLADHPDGRLRSADPGWSNTLQRNESRAQRSESQVVRIRGHRRHGRHPGAGSRRHREAGGSSSSRRAAASACTAWPPARRSFMTPISTWKISPRGSPGATQTTPRSRCIA